MRVLSSKLSGKEVRFVACQQILQNLNFSDGGAWDYVHGFFDCPVDEDKMLFLRIPFVVVAGRLDVEQLNQDTVIRIGEPFALYHKYETEVDETARLRIVGALFDQFQKPANPDAPIRDEQIKLVEQKLRATETALAEIF